MDKLLIHGMQSPLRGEVWASGAKNAALPILAAALLTDEPLRIRNIPHLKDITTMLELLASLGVEQVIERDLSVQLSARQLCNEVAPYDLVRTMRASVLVLGPLLARLGRADVSLPGGCAIGLRPVDLHVEALAALGAECDIADGFIRARAPKGLSGGCYRFPVVSVTGTENMLMAAVLAKGLTVIQNAAREPEVVDLVACLNAMGADITGAGTSEICVKGVPRLNGVTHCVIPDRIETATYLVAAAMTRGQVTVHDTRADFLDAVLEKLEDAGAHITVNGHSVQLDMRGEQAQAVDVVTAPYPDFPTDMQAQFTAMNTVAKGRACVTEQVFENRFMHIQELQRLGARLRVDNHHVWSEGVTSLRGAPVMATDLRASACLVLAGLVATGQTVVDRIYHIDRGYQCIEEKLALLGARIRRIRGGEDTVLTG